MDFTKNSQYMYGIWSIRQYSDVSGFLEENYRYKSVTIQITAGLVSRIASAYPQESNQCSP